MRKEVGRGLTGLAALGLAATLVLSAPAAQAQMSFLTASTYSAGDYPRSITVGDLDGDGDLDLATANYGGYPDSTSSVSVLKNNGNGTFAAQNFTVGDAPRSITVGDLDGDGDLDLATANSFSDNVSVLKNNGNGTFTASQNFAVGDYPSSITVGDLDGDGDLDLATANSGVFPDFVGTVSVLKNNGNGTFASAQNFTVGNRPRSITVGDLDGDGDLDLATANSGSNPDYVSTVSVLKNNGNGTFASAQNFDVGPSPRSITVGDLDGDGDLDLATANLGTRDNSFIDTVSVLKNNGTGTFATAQNFTTGGDRPNSITVGDLDGDGDLDLATANSGYSGYYASYPGSVSVLKNRGDGTLAGAQPFAAGEFGFYITAGDLDGDGDLDIATANYGGYPDYTGSVSVLKNNGNGTFAAPQTFAAGNYPTSITVGDLDGDGDLDLATANIGPDNVSVLKNNGNGTFAAPQTFAAGNEPRSITVGDLDGDGDLDLATAGRGDYPSPSTVSVLKNNGNGTFAAPQNFAVGDFPYSITVGDLDGDGDLDLATANGNSYDVSVLKNNGNGTFAAPQNFAVGDSPYSITVGDLDGDGDLDLATANGRSSTASVLKNNGNGTFAAPQTFASGQNSRSITVRDLDGDGDLDLATANFFSDNVSVLKNNGNGTFAASQNFAVGNDPRSIAVGDLDGDGDLDLSVASVDYVIVLQSTTPTLQLSLSPNRSNPTPLAGQNVSGNLYVFASGKDLDFKRVQFYLDDTDRSGEPIRLERSAPFDFAGGTNMDPTVTQANPFDTRTLLNGEHTITATFARTDGTFRTITSTFTVGN